MKSISLCVMSVLYIGAGVLHFLRPQMYLPVMPPWLPVPLMLIRISGACEILFAVMLFPKFSRVAAAWLIIALLAAIFPANIQMAFNWHRFHHGHEWLAWARLPLQALLIWWAWTFTRK